MQETKSVKLRIHLLNRYICFLLLTIIHIYAFSSSRGIHMPTRNRLWPVWSRRSRNSSSNILWLQSESLSGLANGDDVTTWADVSGNGNDVTQPNVTFAPTLSTNALNGFPSVLFSRSNARIRRNSLPASPILQSLRFTVNINQEVNNDAVLSYAISNSQNNHFLLFSSDNLRVFRDGPTTTGVAFNDNVWHIANTGWQSSNGALQVWKDGTREHNVTGFTTGTTIVSGGTLAIAGEQDQVDGGYSAGQAHQGQFTEIMLFNTYLNEAQHLIVDNYLAAKYNLPIANDFYAFETTHPHEVSGIGREDASNVHTAAQSSILYKSKTPSGLKCRWRVFAFWT